MKLSYYERTMLKNPCWPQEVRQIVEPLLASRMKLSNKFLCIYCGYISSMLKCLIHADLSHASNQAIGVLCSFGAHATAVTADIFTPSLVEDLALIPDTITRLLLLGYGDRQSLRIILQQCLRSAEAGYPDEVIADFVSCFDKVDYAHEKSLLHQVFTKDEIMESVMRAYASVPQSLRESFVYALALGQTPKEAHKNCSSGLTKTSFNTARSLNRYSYRELAVKEHSKSSPHRCWIPFVFDEKIIGRESNQSKLQRLNKIGGIFRQIVCHPAARKYTSFLSSLAYHIIKYRDYQKALEETAENLYLSIYHRRGKMSAAEINEAFEKNDIMKLCEFASSKHQVRYWVHFLGRRPLSDCTSGSLSGDKVHLIMVEKKSL